MHMKTIVQCGILVVIAILLMVGLALAEKECVLVTPDSYKIVIKNISLYDGEKAAWTEIAKGDLAVDLAKADAGELLDGYISWSQLPEGNYPRAKVTLSRKVNIEAFGESAGRVHCTKLPDAIQGVDKSTSTYTQIYNFPKLLMIKKDLPQKIKVSFSVKDSVAILKTKNGETTIYPIEPKVIMEILQ